MRRYRIAVQDQSNGTGTGPLGTPTRTVGYGAPMADPVGPRGVANRSSMWPSLANAAGRRGVWLDIANTAIGSAPMADSWVGRCRQHVSGMTIARGSYVLSGGGVWRANQANPIVQNTTTAPTGTADVTLDGIPWVYLGAPGPRDTDGRIYLPTDTGRFDPNGYILAAADAALAGPGPYDGRGVILSGGTGDRSPGVTREQYRAAIISAATYYMSRGLFVWSSLLVSNSNPDTHVWYLAAAQPGREDAFAHFAGNPMFRRGIDARVLLGQLSETADPWAIGVQTGDNLHYTAMTYVRLGEGTDAALAAGGW